MNLLDNIKALCKEHKVSQRKLEQSLGLSNGSISKWSKSSPSIDVLQKVANYFNVSVDYLTGKTEKNDASFFPATLDFSEPEEAIKFILSQPALMDFGGYDLKNMTDDEILEIANDMLLAMRISLEKRKK